jgi:hypothetical protein
MLSFCAFESGLERQSRDLVSVSTRLTRRIRRPLFIFQELSGAVPIPISSAFLFPIGSPKLVCTLSNLAILFCRNVGGLLFVRCCHSAQWTIDMAD